ncbi:similar to Saccharomyces cerevisiae YGL082W Putative protein of unknown function [Maudiozyma barnettii]|uniref:MINDY deubiquitinase domain-containing protein n=1 Tax=Maudiozyma barnettii TaxID=61262 RepID=A0A8H2VFM5_9SACH|nr:hypothetical protein [Kazachstania barnettii]CAB4254279.1 similar to Saccharomyces cerevisiae YGL082W Putative protein of unknown function [Kazachstania barnettii]CAD1782069.1 similar to Saccharomyces cerevisiae YGL082W Putative protein of unknown function [Kazachstania barnettii]
MNVNFETKEISVNGSSHYILLQTNDEEPSALVALTNVLLLSPSLSSFARNLINLVGSKRSVAMYELVETLANIGIQNPNGINTNINQLLQILPQLQNGLMVNPEFNGSFEDSVEISIFRLYSTGIVHGWIFDSARDPVASEHVSKYSYQEAQRIIVQSYDLMKLEQQQRLDAEQREIVEDATYLKSFLARSASQFTEYGLEHLKELLVERSFAVLYRNEHFYTLYKNNGELYTLVSDYAHKLNSDVVWKSLKSVNGSQDTYQTGSFIPATASNVTSAQNLTAEVSNPFGDDDHPNDGTAYDGGMSHLPQSSAPPAGQMEDDEELARMLQEEEDRVAADRMQGIALMQASHQQQQKKTEQKKSKRKSFFLGGKKNKNSNENVENSTLEGGNINNAIRENKKHKKKKSCIIM